MFFTDSMFFNLCGNTFDTTNILNIHESKTLKDLNYIHWLNQCYILNFFEKLKCAMVLKNNEFQLIKSTFSPDTFIKTFRCLGHASYSKIIHDDKRYCLMYL